MYGEFSLATLCGRLSGMSLHKRALWAAQPPDRQFSQRVTHPSGVWARAALGPRSLLLTIYDADANPALSAEVFGAHAASTDLVQARLAPTLSDLAAAAARAKPNNYFVDRPLTEAEQGAYQCLLASRSA